MDVNILRRSIWGELKRLLCIIKLDLLKIAPPALGHNDIVVSVTSYGRRVRKSVPYVIYDMMYQSMPPSKIVLWLSKDEFDKNKISKSLKRLMKYGVQIRFCEDIRSYKKLIYSLKEFSDFRIITIDDDVIYDRKLIECLNRSSQEHPHCVCAYNYHQPSLSSSNRFIPYNDWTNNTIINSLPCIPVGAGGILYPLGCFDSEVYNKNNFLKLCPDADDIWFWAMEIKNNTQIHCVNSYLENCPLDWFYQHMHKGSSLQHANVYENENDIKINNVFDYYELWRKLS